MTHLTSLVKTESADVGINHAQVERSKWRIRIGQDDEHSSKKQINKVRGKRWTKTYWLMIGSPA